MACLFFRIFVQYKFKFTNESKVTKVDKEIFLLDTDQERPIFCFYLRPWKVETAIRTNQACKVKQGRLFFKKKINYYCF